LPAAESGVIRRKVLPQKHRARRFRRPEWELREANQDAQQYDGEESVRPVSAAIEVNRSERGGGSAYTSAYAISRMDGKTGPRNSITAGPPLCRTAEVEHPETGRDRGGSVQRSRHRQQPRLEADRERQQRGEDDSPASIGLFYAASARTKEGGVVAGRARESHR
jgi:hypothetical protein